MKIYEIWDQESRFSVGTLLCYEKSKTFVIELADYLDEWSAPLILTAYVRRGVFTIPRDVSFMWVRERIIPSGRQNINMILRNHRLREYDELTFREKSGGRCSQDSLIIRRPLRHLKIALSITGWAICFSTRWIHLWKGRHRNFWIDMCFMTGDC